MTVDERCQSQTCCDMSGLCPTSFHGSRSTGEQAYADEILERCLYALEMAWHPWFNPAGGNCRLDFEVEANRPLFTALFRYMQVSPAIPAASSCQSLVSMLGGSQTPVKKVPEAEPAAAAIPLTNRNCRPGLLSFFKCCARALWSEGACEDWHVLLIGLQNRIALTRRDGHKPSTMAEQYCDKVAAAEAEPTRVA